MDHETRKLRWERPKPIGTVLESYDAFADFRDTMSRIDEHH